MPRKSAIDRNKEAAHALVACPASNWTNADIVAAHALLLKFNRGSGNEDYDDAPFTALEEALGKAPATNVPAALAKASWLIEQPGAGAAERHPWERAAYHTLRDFLSPKDDFVAELGHRAVQIIRRARLADIEFDDPNFHAAVAELEATDGLIEASVATSLFGVATQLVVAMGHLEQLKVMTECNDDADLMVHASDIREFVQRIKGLLAVAAPALAQIAGIDLLADLAVDYRTIWISEDQSPDDRPPPSADNATEALKEAA